MGCGRMIDCRSFKPPILRLVYCAVEKQRHGWLWGHSRCWSGRQERAANTPNANTSTQRHRTANTASQSVLPLHPCAEPARLTANLTLACEDLTFGSCRFTVYDLGGASALFPFSSPPLLHYPAWCAGLQVKDPIQATPNRGVSGPT